MSIISCPKCNKEFDNFSKWGLKKFCSRKCANSREQTSEIKERKSKKLSITGNCCYCGNEHNSKGGLKIHERYCLENPNRITGAFLNKQHSLKTKILQGKKNAMGLKVPNSLLDMSKRTTSKIIKRLGIGCFNCGWNLGSCDIHHIIPVSKGGTNDNKNLTHICPNCHRLAHEGKITTFVSVEEKIGNEWRQFYFAHE